MVRSRIVGLNLGLGRERPVAYRKVAVAAGPRRRVPVREELAVV